LMVNSRKKAPFTRCLPYTMARFVPLRVRLDDSQS
jgi:hypothetical protein